MSNHISHASLPYPVKNARYTILVPYLDADGDPTDPTTPDTEVSQDGGAFADAAEEVTTITGTNGLGYVTLTGAEMNNSAVGVAFKVASGPKATLMTLIPRVLAILRASTATAGAAGTITLDSSAVAIDDYYNGCIIRTTGGTGGGGTGGANNQARVITDYVGSTKVASVSPNWETTPDNTTTFDILLTPESWLRYGDLQAWRGAQPNALTSGRVEVLLGAVTAGVIAAASFAANALDAVWSTATRALTDKAGFALSASGVQAIWDALTSALTTVGSIGKLLVDNINATIGSRASQTSVDDVPTNAELATAFDTHEGPDLPTGTVTTDAGNSATSFETDRTETANDYWKDALLLITSGVLIGQVKKVTAYDGTTKIITVSGGFTGTPADGVTFVLVNR